MRSSSKTFVGLAGLGILVAAARAGVPIPEAAANVTDPVTNVDGGPTASATPTPTAAATAAPKPGTQPKPTTKPSSTKPGANATPTPTPAPTPPPATSAAVSKTSASINYEFGTIQIQVTKEAGNITAVSYLKQSYTRVPNGTMAYLVNASIQANGSNFTKVSRATVTTNAYKKALEDALAKF
ncbi:MAG: hypothetical protein RL197_878 [Actinomycetota bacterium]